MRLDELEALLEQTAALSETSIAADVFSPRLLEAAMRAAAAAGAALWAADYEGVWRDEAVVGSVEGGHEGRVAFARAAADKRRILFVPPGGRAETGGPLNESDGWLLFAPAPSGRVLELCLGRDVGNDRRLLTEVARSFAELAGGFFERQELSVLRQRAMHWRRLEAFVAAVHAPLDLAPTAYAVANEGRLIVGCDRLSVALGRRGRIAAVSGVERPDRRADAVGHIERIAAATVRSGGQRWLLTEDSPEGPPLPRPLARAWQEYRTAVGAKQLEVIVLRGRDNRDLGVLVAEWFGEPRQEGEGLESIAVHAGSALTNARQATPGFFGRALRTVAAPFRLRHLPKSLLVVTAAAAVAAMLLFWEIDFSVAARGQLRPAAQNEVFAPRDGIVRSLNVRHGQSVRTGDTLLELADPALDFDLERVLGELRTSRQRLISVQAARTTGPAAGRANDAGRSAQLAGEEKELLERLAGLERQLEILERERDALKVVSPIDGVVLTWETADRLESRPVRRGQRLLTVARPEGDWLLELYVPDRKIGHVREARAASDGKLAIDYLLATDPSVTHHETVDSIALSTERHIDDEPSVRLTAHVERSQVRDPRPGATVVANVRCGQRPAGYVWFRELIEAIQTRVLF